MRVHSLFMHCHVRVHGEVYQLGAVMESVPRNILEYVLCSANTHIPVVYIFRRRNVGFHHYNYKDYLSFNHLNPH